MKYEYKILTESTAGAFGQVLSEYIKAGWSIHGHHQAVYQPMSLKIHYSILVFKDVTVKEKTN